MLANTVDVHLAHALIRRILHGGPPCPRQPNYLWGRPVTPLASIRDGLTDVLGPDVLVGADLSTDRTQRRRLYRVWTTPRRSPSDGALSPLHVNPSTNRVREPATGLQRFATEAATRVYSAPQLEYD